RRQDEGRQRNLVEIEAVGDVVGIRIASAERGKAEALLDKFQHRRELVLGRRNVSLSCLVSDDEQRISRTQAKGIALRRSNVIIVSPEVIPDDEDRCRTPQ